MKPKRTPVRSKKVSKVSIDTPIEDLEPTEPTPQVEATDLSDAPPLDPRLGDKTPAFVEWLRDTDPAAFAVRYAKRRTHLG